jgi:hypothetical protein
VNNIREEENSWRTRRRKRNVGYKNEKNRKEDKKKGISKDKDGGGRMGEGGRRKGKWKTRK